MYAAQTHVRNRRSEQHLRARTGHRSRVIAAVGKVDTAAVDDESRARVVDVAGVLAVRDVDRA
jgi:hypothetical protein